MKNSNITTKEVLEITGITRQHLTYYQNIGKLTPVGKLGRSLMWDKEQVDKFAPSDWTTSRAERIIAKNPTIELRNVKETIVSERGIETSEKIHIYEEGVRVAIVSSLESVENHYK